jgi:hypothetical protein
VSHTIFANSNVIGDEICFDFMLEIFSSFANSLHAHFLFGAVSSIAKNLVYLFRSDNIRLCTPLVALYITGIFNFSCKLKVVVGFIVLWITIPLGSNFLTNFMISELNFFENGIEMCRKRIGNNLFFFKDLGINLEFISKPSVMNDFENNLYNGNPISPNPIITSLCNSKKY